MKMNNEINEISGLPRIENPRALADDESGHALANYVLGLKADGYEDERIIRHIIISSGQNADRPHGLPVVDVVVADPVAVNGLVLRLAWLLEMSPEAAAAMIARISQELLDRMPEPVRALLTGQCAAHTWKKRGVSWEFSRN